VRTVQLFVTCLVDTFFPRVGEAVVDVLQRAGAQVDFPIGQTCCGQPPFNAGLRSAARRVAKQTIRAFESAEGDVVLPSGSCTHMIRHNYVELFSDEPAWLQRAHDLAGRTYEFTEYLVDVLGVSEWDAPWDGALAYHPTCHLHRGIGVDRQPRALLSMLKGAEIHELPEQEDCCGFGGIFSVEHPELSAAMLDRKIANFGTTAAQTLVVCDAGCLMHIQGGLRRRGNPQKVIHIAEALAHR
jgi:L-lactate dehydrogenase complex protein LldE